MKLPGMLALGMLFRRLAGELNETNRQLRRIADAQELTLKFAAMQANTPLWAVREAEEVEPVAGGAADAAPAFLAQSDAELAVEERLREAYVKAHGHEPGEDEDLIELFKKGGGEAAALRAAGEALELERRGE